MPSEAMRGDDVADLVAAGDMGMQNRADVTVKFGRGAVGFGLDLRAEIEAFLPVELDDGLPERLLYALVAQQPGIEIAGIADAVGEAGGIERGFGGARAGVGPRHKGGIAGQHHATEYQPRRNEIVDRLEERRGPRKYGGN